MKSFLILATILTSFASFAQQTTDKEYYLHPKEDIIYIYPQFSIAMSYGQDNEFDSIVGSVKYNQTSMEKVRQSLLEQYPGFEIKFLIPRQIEDITVNLSGFPLDKQNLNVYQDSSGHLHTSNFIFLVYPDKRETIREKLRTGQNLIAISGLKFSYALPTQGGKIIFNEACEKLVKTKELHLLDVHHSLKMIEKKILLSGQSKLINADKLKSGFIQDCLEVDQHQSIQLFSDLKDINKLKFNVISGQLTQQQDLVELKVRQVEALYAEDVVVAK